MSGPNVNPMPNAAPISAIPFERFSGGVLSAMTADAVTAHGPRPNPMTPRSTEAERAAHLAFLQANLKDRSLWEGYGLDTQAA